MSLNAKAIWNQLDLRRRIYLVLSTLVFITLMGGIIMIWYTYRIEALLTTIADKNLVALETSTDLETALANQKGFVTYYFLDGDPDWLRRLGEYRQIFKNKIQTARDLENDPTALGAIERIASEYESYIALKDEVILLYQSGKPKAGERLHREVRSRFFIILDLCEKYKTLHLQNILRSRQSSRARAVQLRGIAAVAIVFDLLLAALLVTIMVKEILGPIRKLAQAVAREGLSTHSENIVKVLSSSVYDLLQNMDDTQSELKKSRENLLQAEKMAMVGKLAAGMAHSIRNPFTSVKMRLFSLGRSLELSGPQHEDFDVISGEIRHIDTIVQNFLEFSRPPKLMVQAVSPSAVVDATLQLLSHRLNAYEVAVNLQRKRPLPEIAADPEQLKEVLVNLIVNACEAMARGGSIAISEGEENYQTLGRAAVIRLRDNGPGIPESIQDKVMQPFYTTKDEGTGLGLSIARRIINEHRGRLDMISQPGMGTTFIIALPIVRPKFE